MMIKIMCGVCGAWWGFLAEVVLHLLWGWFMALPPLIPGVLMDSASHDQALCSSWGSVVIHSITMFIIECMVFVGVF